MFDRVNREALAVGAALYRPNPIPVPPRNSFNGGQTSADSNSASIYGGGHNGQLAIDQIGAGLSCLFGRPIMF